MKNYIAWFVPSGEIVKTFQHEIEAENLYEAKFTFSQLSAQWKGQFVDIEEVS